MDWIFRYGNEKLAEVERVPLSGLIGNSFGNIFSNMDDKWLFPDIFGTLRMYVLFPLDEIHCAQKQDELSQIWKNYLLKQE